MKTQETLLHNLKEQKDCVSMIWNLSYKKKSTKFNQFKTYIKNF